MSESLLSILLPVRNEAEHLKIMVPILEAILEHPHEVLIIYDFPEDNSIPVSRLLQSRYNNIRLIHNDLGSGVTNAIKKGVEQSKGELILVMLADEIFPILAISDMLELMNAGCQLVSGTRYGKGGRRFGGSLLGGILSRFANYSFRMISGSVFTDATASVKMFRKEIFDDFRIDSKVGGTFGFEMAIKCQTLNFRTGEVPLISVDRVFGGESSFRLFSWLPEYLKWYFWGLKKISWWNRRSRPLRIEALKNRRI